MLVPSRRHSREFGGKSCSTPGEDRRRRAWRRELLQNGSFFYFFHPFPIQFRRNLGRLDFRTFTPENSRVEDGNAGSLQMAVNRRLVLQNGIFFQSVYHTHDLRSSKNISACSPITMGHADVAPAFRSSPDFHAGGNRPMEQSVVFGNGAVVRFGSHMFQKSGETADDMLPVQFFRRTAVFFRFQSCPCGPEGPGIFHHFLRPELFLDGEEHLPFQF